jgi:hypothetical protein
MIIILNECKSPIPARVLWVLRNQEKIERSLHNSSSDYVVYACIHKKIKHKNLQQFHRIDSRPNLFYSLLHIFFSPVSWDIANKQSMICLRCWTLYLFTLKRKQELNEHSYKIPYTRKIKNENNIHTA